MPGARSWSWSRGSGCSKAVTAGAAEAAPLFRPVFFFFFGAHYNKER